MMKPKNKIDQLIENLKHNLPGPKNSNEIIDIGHNYDTIKDIKDNPGVHCGVDAIADIFSWKKGFSYLFTGTPNTGKTTMALYMFLLMSFRQGYKWCIWSPEMEDSTLSKNGIQYNAKDIIFTLMWTLSGVTPYEFYSKSHGLALMTDDEKRTAYNWITDHFKFIHLGDRTPAGIMEGFNEVNNKFNIDGFLIDPWKSVKQVMDTRADIWLEDALMEFKTFSLETNSIMNYIVHPKSMRDYKDQDGQFRVITPFDLNGGAAWNNSMDVIVSMRRFEEMTEWHSQKIRKQHLIGKRGSYENISFEMDKYRFFWNGFDPLNMDINLDTGEVGNTPF